MGLPGYGEWIGLIIIGLIFFGPRQLPKLMRDFGRGVNEIKRHISEAKRQLDENLRDLDDTPKYEPPAYDTTDESLSYNPPSYDVPVDEPSNGNEPPPPEAARPEDPDDRRLKPLF